jgi:hypothetical protein
MLIIWASTVSAIGITATHKWVSRSPETRHSRRLRADGLLSESGWIKKDRAPIEANQVEFGVDPNSPMETQVLPGNE